MTSDPNARPTTYAADMQAAAQLLLAHSGPVVVLAHENPDGDALGSVLGLSRALRALGKTVYAPLDPPRYLQFLPKEGELCAPLTEWPAGALAAVLDVDNNDPVRVAGADLSEFDGPVINIDHHGTNQRRATVSVVDPSQPATAQLLAELIDALGAEWTPEIATPLLLGLITDTGSFQFASTGPETFRTAARLVEYGGRLGWLNEQRAQNTPTYFYLLREVLGSLEFLHGGEVVLARVDQGMLQRAGAEWEDVEAYVGLLRSAEGSRLAVVAKDLGDRVKFSLRSKGGVSAQNVAVALGGGGHVPAAGATLEGSYPAARARLEAAIAAELERAGPAAG
ncbi:bifunctional oligoribonuclease/PAP phosphatase NrnA [Deinococcus lacus]|uniref:Bifunctional oligoribonuclease/PAP phosphatase NrnA n=1 Tax=Deinococcus lacus TaxID=392561 RepID=A0ABW1YA78_9DEIO